MELLSVLLTILASPFKAVARPARAIFAKALTASLLGPVTPAHAYGHQSLADNVCVGMALLPKNWNNNTSYAAVDKFFDMSEYDGVMFIIQIGGIDVSIDAKAQESANADGSSPSDISGAAITQVGSTSDNRVVIVDVKKTTFSKQYAGLAVNVPNGTTNNIAVVAIRYNKIGNLPVTQQIAAANSYATAEIIKV